MVSPGLDKQISLLRSDIRSIEERTRAEVTRLYDRIAELEKAIPSQTQSADDLVAVGFPVLKPVHAPTHVTKADSISHLGRFGEVWLGQRGLLVAGIVIVFLGVGLFLKYAFENHLIAEPIQLGMAYCAAIGLAVVGNRVRSRFQNWGDGVCGLGFILLYLATWAGYSRYHVFSHGLTTCLLLAITGVIALYARYTHVQAVAVLGLIGGFATPVMLSTDRNTHVALMGYLAMLNLGYLWLGLRKRWASLVVVSFVGTWGLVCGWCYLYGAGTYWLSSEAYLQFFYAVFALTPFAYVRRSGSQRAALLWIIPLNGMLALLCSHHCLSSNFLGDGVWIVALIYAAVSAVLATWLRVRRPGTPGFLLLTANAATFLAVAGMLLLSADWITLFGLVEGIGLLYVARAVRARQLAWLATVFVVMAVGKFVLFGTGYMFLMHGGGFVHGYSHGLIARWLTEGLAIFGSAQALLLLGEGKSDPHRKATLVSISLGLFCLTLELAGIVAEFVPAFQLAAISILWATAAIALLVVGLVRGDASVRIYGLILFAVTFLKVIFVDMEDAALPFRIGSFLALGCLLLMGSFLYHRFRDHVADAVPPKGTIREPT